MIELIDVNFEFQDKVALKDINLKIDRSELAVIVGPNGSGKSTLVNVICGIYAPVSGKVVLFDREDYSELRKKISFVPQKVSSFNQLFPISVKETILLGLVSKRGYFRSYTKEDMKKVDEILEMLALSEVKDKQLGKLSGGQQQRVFIGKALISEPELLILDEPTVGIDSKSEELLYQLLLNEKKKNTTIVMVTHDIFAIKDYADKVICMKDGQILTICNAQEFSTQKYKEIYVND
ncbi:High-affinity zinc uptake system ATP-binding protein ZnuC [Caloramator mitchellensis]|uniref:High-affinity zinc uptake system ATP-binding protein ZnuC n=1 Tax=Caloramator mitchellensis TaxID=908809 RepID=A0A0R3JU82_CALMK|nr:metal ABC transporter ATP-binding protein [Caloramator mitchellensis]KRQ87099.1 High-affinity zinc uptake system ATP-binding protein ZnuC [Caloramator mitchellensis]